MENLDAPTPKTEYAGFWLRFAACLIDGLIIGAVQFIVILPIIGMMGFQSVMSMQGMDAEGMSDEEKMALAAGMIGSIAMISILATVFQWLYYALMESSSKQGTLGKMALGIVVTDINGNRISFLRATGRYFGKIISAMIILFGYIMAGFTEKKQALHDIMAGCLVVKK